MIDEILDSVYGKLLGENSVLIKMQQRQGLDEIEFQELKKHIGILAEFYKDKDSVPKKLALCFVDISNYFYFNEGYYSENEQNRLEDAVHEISYLANTLFD